MCLLSILFHTVPTPTVSLSPPGPIHNATMGSPQIINCTVITVSGVDSSSVLISWTGPGGGSIIDDSRVSISPTTSSGNNYTSSVQFTYLMEGDEGTYTCNVMILEAYGSQSLNLSLLAGKLSPTYHTILLCILKHMHTYDTVCAYICT